ncbi:hypothetical protein Acav_2804 [Paracidovorax avenae ATCC 19860]|uniref:Uncharacterized protein n=1 Tax=Paracidovorax avenae (strain ATCC 19860 / DSM 7227 / CCUG 15838 / JCM 20985 / LMG 2117 / NCPPB 1011) TaxID=643561 RepID=F0Q402_PARA1|nr:hypothetical protein [Paracidovorax avenae]ADX46711.1 hypothetical protein Acav_2804 [Paracidovorax avenae ATCC 19860]
MAEFEANSFLGFSSEARLLIAGLRSACARLRDNKKLNDDQANYVLINKLALLIKELSELKIGSKNASNLTKLAEEIYKNVHEFYERCLKKIILSDQEKAELDSILINAKRLVAVFSPSGDINAEEHAAWRGRSNELQKLAIELRARFAALSGAAESTEQKMAAIEARLNALSESGGESAKIVSDMTQRLERDAKIEFMLRAKAIQDELEEVQTGIRSQAELFGGYHEQAKNMLGQLSSTILSGGYIGSAQSEERSANLFRWLCIGLMGLTVAFLAYTILQLSFNSIDWKNALTRLVATLLMAVPTAYLARESGKHRHQANKLRRTSLDFHVLEPFLQKLEGEFGTKLRTELAQRVFFVEGGEDKAPSYAIDPQELIIKILEALSKVGKR